MGSERVAGEEIDIAGAELVEHARRRIGLLDMLELARGCDLDQQRKRNDARKDSLARAAAWRLGRRSVLDRLLRRPAPRLELSATDLAPCEGEDVFHGFLV